MVERRSGEVEKSEHKIGKAVEIRGWEREVRMNGLRKLK